MKTKIILLAALSAASFGLTQAANAQTVGSPPWHVGDCFDQNVVSERPCVEYNGGHAFTPNPIYEPTEWHGIPGPSVQEPFTFSGPTRLECNGIIVDCTLALEGKVNITPEGVGNSPYNIGIQVTDAEVTGGPLTLCGLVEVTGFPWHIGPNGYHGPYSSNVGIPYIVGGTPPIDLIASIGPIGVYAPLVTDFSGGHMHDVTYNNLDTFSFGTGDSDPNIYLNGEDHDSSGCTVEGDLRLQPIGDTLIIH